MTRPAQQTVTAMTQEANAANRSVGLAEKREPAAIPSRSPHRRSGGAILRRYP